MSDFKTLSFHHQPSVCIKFSWCFMHWQSIGQYWSVLTLQVPSNHFLSNRANDFFGQVVGLHNPIVLKDHRKPYLKGLERWMVLTFEWTVSTPKPLVWGEVSPFSVPLRVKMEQKSSSFSQPIECKRASFPKELSVTFSCVTAGTQCPLGMALRHP